MICQPWAWAIFQAPHRKRIENRTWYSGHRGPLLILAGKSKSYLGAIGWLRDMGQPCPPAAELVYGAIIGVVEQVGCGRARNVLDRFPDQSVYIEGPWCHVYDQARLFGDPVPWRGQQGMFRVPRDAVAHQMHQLSAVGK